MRDQDVFLERALLEQELLDKEKLDAARRFGTENGVDLVDALVATEILTSRQIALTRADVCEVPFVELRDFEMCYANTSIIARDVAERYCAIPMFMLDGVLTLAMDDPLNLQATDHIRRIAKCEVDAVLAGREEIRALIAKAYSLGHSERRTTIEVDVEGDAAREEAASQPVVAAVNQLLADAVEQRASDIHVNPDEHELHLRYRIDGVLHEKQGPPLSMHAGIVQRLKVMANLDLTQTRRPQDGKFRFRHERQTIDVRMSTVPTVCGENVVLRLLTHSQQFQDFHELGMPATVATEIEEVITAPHGILLVTGPTGSGKTTTLYTALGKLNHPSRNLLTIEDPVEIRMPYVRQIQVNPEINLTFASALRSILRQDPDVVLVGEIRDDETATIALQAALTGHLVLSTLHTNDAVGAIARLRDFGLPPFVINSALLGVVAQRLARRVCGHCTEPAEPTAEQRRRFALDDGAAGFVHGAGCGRCGQTGYRGRIGLFEFLRLDDAVRRCIEDGGSSDRVRRVARGQGMRLMWQQGLEAARLGQTTLDEVLKLATITESDGAQARERPGRMVA